MNDEQRLVQDEFFEKMLGADKGAKAGTDKGYKRGWHRVTIERPGDGSCAHLLTFHYQGLNVDYVRRFSLNEEQGRQVVDIIFPRHWKARAIEAENQVKKLEAELEKTALRAVEGEKGATYWHEEWKKIDQMLRAVRDVMGQPKDDTTPENQWVRIYYAKLENAAKIALDLAKRRGEQRDGLAKELREVRKQARSWMKMLNQFNLTKLYKWALEEGPPVVFKDEPPKQEEPLPTSMIPWVKPANYTNKTQRRVAVEVWLRPFGSTRFWPCDQNYVIKPGDGLDYRPEATIAEVEFKVTPIAPDGGVCADLGCEGYGCANCLPDEFPKVDFVCYDCRQPGCPGCGHRNRWKTPCGND